MATQGIKIDISKAVAKLNKAGISLDPKRLLGLVGQRQLKWVNDNFKAEGLEIKWKPLSPNTVAGRRKGSSAVLQDTGRLRQSFVAKPTGTDRIVVGSSLALANIHHRGSKPYTIRPVSKKALMFMTPSGPAFAQVVRHPGIPRRPLIPSVALIRKLAVQTLDGVIKKLG